MYPVKQLYSSPLHWTGQTKQNKRLTSWDKDSQRSLTNYNGQSRLDLGKLFDLVTNQYQSSILRSRANIKTPHSFHLVSSASSPAMPQGSREWRLRSVHLRVFCNCSGGGVLALPQRGVPPTADSSPWTAPVWDNPYNRITYNLIVLLSTIEGAWVLIMDMGKNGKSSIVHITHVGLIEHV